MTDSQKVEPIRRRHHCVTASGGDRSRRWSLTPPLALRSFDARKDFVFGGPPRLWPVDFVGLSARVKSNEVWRRIDGENCFLLL
ncbi:hypothetical protein [Bradyrhizobium sp. SZCCHNS3051]|uniref:hypothetical protein n=1 Tax=Bradyrhizobium sp. SZCCHNS3051 TaxID=3057320 RepID=UPI0029165840|nr:hypothetical protein [Bradyrhizobium sp. SZCCHNS3051]